MKYPINKRHYYMLIKELDTGNIQLHICSKRNKDNMVLNLKRWQEAGMIKIYFKGSADDICLTM